MTLAYLKIFFGHLYELTQTVLFNKIHLEELFQRGTVSHLAYPVSHLAYSVNILTSCKCKAEPTNTCVNTVDPVLVLTAPQCGGWGEGFK